MTATFGSITMSAFGWLAVGMEMCCVILKDCYLWKNHFHYRYGVDRKIASFLIFGSYILTEFFSEYAGLTGKKSMMLMFLALFLLFVYLLTDNGYELMGRTVVYWLASYLPWVILESLTGKFPITEGSVDYYQTPGRILPNIAILLVSFCLMCFLWKKRIFHWIPAKFCIVLCLFLNSTEYLRLAWTTGSDQITWGQTVKITAILLFYTAIPIGMVLFYSIRQKQKIKIAETCRKQFYEKIQKIQHEAGKFRHDLANHMEVVSRYRQEDASQDVSDRKENNNREQKSRQCEQQYEQKMQQSKQWSQKYEQKLLQRKAELETGSYSGDKRMDFILEQIRQLALARGCVLEVSWEAESDRIIENDISEKEPENEERIRTAEKIKTEERTRTAEKRKMKESITESEMENLTDRCLEAVAKKSFWWGAVKYSGKKSEETLKIFRKDGTLNCKICRHPNILSN